jgi:hypothetical protein
MILSLLPAATLGYNQPPKELKQAEWQVLSLMNHYRANRGLRPLRMANRVHLVARDRSRDMRNKGYFAHGSPTGESAGTLLHKRGVRHFGWGENIGWISFLGWDQTTRGMVDAWKGSSGHNRLLLTRDYNYVGIGIAKTKTSAYYTIVFVKQNDHTAPASGMVASSTGLSVASAEGGRRSVTVRWWGRDRLLQHSTAGIRGFTVQKRTRNGWQTLRRNTLTHSLTANLAEGTHKFRVRAVDKRGNKGNWRRQLTVTVY